jgi:hypothetical protein
MVHNSLSGGTTLQPIICCAVLHCIWRDYSLLCVTLYSIRRFSITSDYLLHSAPLYLARHQLNICSIAIYCALLCLVILYYNNLSTVLCSTVPGETTADNPLHLTLSSKTAAESLLRSPLSFKTILQPTFRSARLGSSPLWLTSLIQLTASFICCVSTALGVMS